MYNAVITAATVAMDVIQSVISGAISIYYLKSLHEIIMFTKRANFTYRFSLRTSNGPGPTASGLGPSRPRTASSYIILYLIIMIITLRRPSSCISGIIPSYPFSFHRSYQIYLIRFVMLTFSVTLSMLLLPYLNFMKYNLSKILVLFPKILILRFSSSILISLLIGITSGRDTYMLL